MTTTSTASKIPAATETVELAPSYTISIALTALALPLLLVQLWLGGITALLGLFLLFQTTVIRLRFTETALDVYRQETLLRHFPYESWQNWRIFWFNLPILFYFREVNSIHFLPVLFDPKLLRICLEQRCPRLP